MEELALHILDLYRNAVEAGARTVWITVREDSGRDLLEIEVRDDGRGMTPEQVRAATDPFYTTRTTRRVGLGLPLLQAAAQAAGGDLAVESAPGRGTCVRAWFRLGHIDRAPLGNMAATVQVALADEGGPDLWYQHEVDGDSFRFSTRQLDGWVGAEARYRPEVLAWVYRHVEEGEKMLHGRWSQSEVPGGSGSVAR
ncbi:MAG TPA: ATP-binding protein [Firmicutes bacterium]|nr:ATP-binding protein [Bacillota bacterium]